MKKPHYLALSLFFGLQGCYQKANTAGEQNFLIVASYSWFYCCCLGRNKCYAYAR